VPVAAFSVSPASPKRGAELSFDASATTDDATPSASIQVRWDFDGDGAWDSSFSTTKTATWSYATLGTYTAKLEAKDGSGLVGAATRSITVSESGAPTISITGSATPYTSLSTTYTAIVTDDDTAVEAIEVRWSYDGSTWTDWSTVKTSSHVFAADGGYTVRAEARDSWGIMTAAQLPVTASTPTIPRNGLVAEYLFNGDAKDTSGRGNDGIVNVATLAMDRFNAQNQAYSFDGSTATIVGPSSSTELKPPMPLSYSVWIHQAGTPPTNSYIVINDNSTTAYSGARVYVLPTGQVEAEICDGSGKGSDNRLGKITNNVGILSGSWHHVCAVLSDAVHLSVYVDGILQSTYSDGSGSALGYTSGKLVLGVTFHGFLDDFRFYNRALSDAEIQLLYHEGGWAGN
jgi:hypothetical protein